MKLELKHLAGYLPYGMKYEWSNSIYYYEHCSTRDFDYENSKPILRPLSDLKKYIGNFCFEEWVQESSCPEEYKQYTRCIYETFDDGSLIDLHYLSYRIIKKMYEYHFDIERLIPTGLAIDINTL